MAPLPAATAGCPYTPAALVLRDFLPERLVFPPPPRAPPPPREAPAAGGKKAGGGRKSGGGGAAAAAAAPPPPSEPPPTPPPPPAAQRLLSDAPPPLDTDGIAVELSEAQALLAALMAENDSRGAGALAAVAAAAAARRDAAASRARRLERRVWHVYGRAFFPSIARPLRAPSSHRPRHTRSPPPPFSPPTRARPQIPQARSCGAAR
jgi:hypothetical protein